MSQDKAVANPPPRQKPSIIAIVGLGNFCILSSVLFETLSYCNTACSRDLLSLNSDISAPEEKDLFPFINEEDQTIKVDKCLILNIQDKFIKFLLHDESFRNLSSKEKVEKYKATGHKIGKNVKIFKGAVLIGNIIEIEDNVSIGNDTYIESPEINIGQNTTIGNNLTINGDSIIHNSKQVVTLGTSLKINEENITQAESTIRDTKMASEMSALTKDKIMLQASTAMIAQANQVPETVLSLIQNTG